MNFDGLVLSLVVFDILPRFPSANSDLPNNEEGMRALQVARSEMETIPAEASIRKAHMPNFPAASQNTLQIDQKVLVYQVDGKPTK